MNDDVVISDVRRKIERERALINGATVMRASTNNPTVQSAADNEIREGRRNLDYLESTLRQLELRKSGGPSQGRAGNPSEGRGSPNQNRNTRQVAGRGTTDGPSHAAPVHDPHIGHHGGDEGDYGEGEYSNLESAHTSMPPRAPFSAPPPGSNVGRVRPNYSRLDLIKWNTPHLGPRIQLMLSQLEFKLSVEKQYKDGIEKIMGSYSMDGDRKIKAEARDRRTESMKKIQLLQLSLKRYEDLHVEVDSASDPADDDSINGPSMRKPLTGMLSMRIHAVSDLNHTASTRLGRGPETFVILKVEDEIKGRTKSTKTDRWTDELHEIDIDKGNEIELTVYDKSGSDHPIPIGMLWIRISDIAEEMRRKKIETELNNSGWVSADQTLDNGRPSRSETQHANPSTQGHVSSSDLGFNATGANQSQATTTVIDNWFSLEPFGRIQLSMTFAKQTRERRPFEAGIGLNRKGAIRQRKEDVHELYGHKFIAQQFYNIMRCALCGELLKYAGGMQCADCKYMCHEKCYPMVVTKCISKSNAESDPDEAKLNHRIPHRFEGYGNIGANWCCHCGYILPLGRKSCRRCKECKLTCHAQCTHLVADFCGMSMKDANLILGEIQSVKAKSSGAGGMANRSLRPPGREPKSRPSPASAPSYMAVSDTESTSSKGERFSYGNDPSTTTLPSSRTSDSSLSVATYSYNTVPAQRSSAERRPVPAQRQESSLAAQAAANALAAGKQRRPEDGNRASAASAASSSSVATERAGASQRPSAPSQPSTYARYDPQAYAEIDRQYAQAAALDPPPRIPPPRVYPSAPSVQEPNTPMASMQPSPVDMFVERRDVNVNTRTQGSGRRIGLDHFNFLAVLGKGNFGKVMLAETKATKQLYAIKVLKKEFIIENDEVESTRSERDVFIIANKARHPFLLNLHACFQTETRVYFVMEYISGGDLMLHIQRGQFGTKRAQFYAAEVCLALKYLHENGVVYRDLKLDNIMLTMDGHIKLADYGLCKKEMYYGSTTSTFCGTPEFMAPEILLDKKYGRAVDWWAFGVLIYQMLLQQSPFRGEDEDEIYDAILADEPLYPIHMPKDSVSILQKLLTREPELRLGSGPTDAQEVMSHAFFRTVNWQDVQDRKVAPPFLPQIKSATDTSNFDSEFTSVTPVLTPVQSVLTGAMQEEFRGFSYSADFV